MNKPLVSVLMPCYNHSRYVETAILSVLEQSYENIELIIIDDGSQDETWSKIEKFIEHPKVRAYRRSNKGLIETIKELRSLSKGVYLTVLASDDRFYPNKIEIMLDSLLKNSSAAICVGKTDIIDSNNFVIGTVKDEYDGRGDLSI